MASAKQPFLSKLSTVLVLAIIFSWLICCLASEALAGTRVRQESRKQTSRGSGPAPLPELLDLQGLTRLLARHRGQVVLLNFWATWCEPCRQEFASLKQLQERYRHRGLVVFAISVDVPSAYSQVRTFLGQLRPSFSTYLKKPGEDEEFINAMDPSWTGALPATFVYDSTGKRVRSLFGEQKPDAFDAAVRDFLPRTNGADHPPRENRGPRPSTGG